MTLYPITKCTPARAADLIEIYGTERVMVNSAGDWGHSDPLAVPELIFEMRRRGHADALIRKVVYENPLTFFAQSARFDFVAERDGRNGRRRLNRIRKSLDVGAVAASTSRERGRVCLRVIRRRIWNLAIRISSTPSFFA